MKYFLVTWMFLCTWVLMRGVCVHVNREDRKEERGEGREREREG